MNYSLNITYRLKYRIHVYVYKYARISLAKDLPMREGM